MIQQKGLQDMKKLLILITVLALLAGSLVSCGKAAYDYNYADYLTLGTYSGVEVSKKDIQAEIDSQIESVLANNAYYEETGKPAADGNRITYSYTGTVDGAAVDALTADNRTTVAAQGATGFTELDEALVGMSANGKKDVNVTIPDSYADDPSIAGKKAVLSVTVSAVETYVTPDKLTDEMISESSGGEYATVDAYKEYLWGAVKQNLAWNKTITAITFKGYPKKEAENYYNNYLNSYKNQAAQYGMTLEQLASAYGATLDTLQAMLAQNAVSQVNQDMAMCAIAEKENLVPGEEQLNAAAQELISYYGYEDEKALYKAVGKDAVKMSATYEMVLDFVAEHAIEID